MKRAKRMLALVLAVMLLGTSMAGCSGNVSGESTGKEDTAGTDEKKAEESVQSGGTESFKLTVHSSAYQGDWNDYWIIKEIEKRFDVDIQVEMISNDVWNDKLPLMFASDELPDFFLNSLTPADIVTYGTEGYLLDLKDYISEDTTPNIWAALAETPALKAAITQTDGKIYSICGADMQTRELALNRFYINTVWAGITIRSRT